MAKRISTSYGTQPPTGIQTFNSLFIILMNLVSLIGWYAIAFPRYIIQNVPNAHGLFWASSQFFKLIMFGFILYFFSAVSLISLTFFTV